MAPAAEREQAGANAVHIPGLVVNMWNAWRTAGHLGLLARQPLNLDLVWATLGLVATILAGITVLLWVKRWRNRVADQTDPETELANYRALFENGMLSAEEWERIRARWEGKKLQKAPQEPPANGAPKPGPSNPPSDQGLP